MTAALLAVRFVSELALVAVLVVVGAELGRGIVTSVLLAVLLPTFALLLWGLLVAPKAGRRLPDPARLLVELALFLGSAAGLAAVGYPGIAVAFAVVAVGAALLVRRRAPGA